METMERRSGLNVEVPRAEQEGDFYYPICFKELHLEAGQIIPRCCGRVMEPR